MNATTTAADAPESFSLESENVGIAPDGGMNVGIAEPEKPAKQKTSSKKVKPTAKKTPAAKKTPKKGSKPVKPEPEKSNVPKTPTTKSLTEGSTRVRLFKSLSKTDDLSAADIKRLTGMAENSGHLSVVLAKEIAVGRISRREIEGKNGRTVVAFRLTAKGKKDWAAGADIDKNSQAGVRIGTAWSKKRLQVEKAKHAK